jgi:hypothetical protein
VVGGTHCGSKHVDHAYSLRLCWQIMAAAWAGVGFLDSQPRGMMSSCSPPPRQKRHSFSGWNLHSINRTRVNPTSTRAGTAALTQVSVDEALPSEEPPPNHDEDS